MYELDSIGDPGIIGNLNLVPTTGNINTLSMEYGQCTKFSTSRVQMNLLNGRGGENLGRI
eukprot:SAG31_NODE_12052_length_973_cov_9.822654_1_plen_60_part_00